MVPQPAVVYNAAIGLAAQGALDTRVDGLTFVSPEKGADVYITSAAPPREETVAEFVPQPDGSLEMRIPGLGVTAIATQADMTAIMEQLRELEVPYLAEARRI